MLLMKKDWLIIADGVPLPTSAIQTLAQDKCVMVLDGALSQITQYHITPTVIIGDFDSVDAKILKQYEKNPYSQIVHDTDQHTTDLEKALHYLCKINPRSVTICNALGKRSDHTLYNLRLLKRFHEKLSHLRMITEHESISFARDTTIQFSSSCKQIISFFGFPSATISSTNLEYEFNNFKLEFAVQESISNVILPGETTITIQGDVLLVVYDNTQSEKSKSFF